MTAPRIEPARPRAPYIQTWTGLAFPLLEPDPAKVTARDLAAALSKICRYTGHCRAFYSVAQHSVLVANNLPVTPDGALALYGLLHDAHEAYVGDLSSPLKRALEQAAGAAFLKPVTQAIDRAIHEAFGIDWPPGDAIVDRVKRADLQALATEKRDIMALPVKGEADWAVEPDWGIDLPPPWSHIQINPWSPEQAETIFARSLDAALSRYLGRKNPPELKPIDPKSPSVGSVGPRAVAGE